MSDFCHCILLKKLDFKSKPYISVRMRPLVHPGVHNGHLGLHPVFDDAPAHAQGLCKGAETPGHFAVLFQELEHRPPIGGQAKGEGLLACTHFEAQGDDVPLVVVLTQDRLGAVGREALLGILPTVLSTDTLVV